MPSGRGGGSYATTCEREASTWRQSPGLYTQRCMEVWVGMTRTNIELDDEIIERAMALYGTRTKKETVDLALRRLVGTALNSEEALALEGGGWDGDLDVLRDDLPPQAV